MDLLPTPEQDEIIATVRTQLDRDFDLTPWPRSTAPSSVVDRSLWERCAALGWFGLGLAEPLGGVGYTLVEEALLFAELGAHATPGPFLATVLGGRLAALAGHVDLAGSILAGELVVALAEPERRRADAVVGPTVDGTFRVTDHGGADLLLVMTDDHAAVVCAPTAWRRRPWPRSTRSCRWPPPRCPNAGRWPTWTTPPVLRLRGTVLVAAELAGIARATAEQSTEYAKDREQFGRPIGSFQAVKHRCADMAVRAEAATSLVRYAALAVVDGLPDAAFHAHAARSVAADAAVANARGQRPEPRRDRVHLGAHRPPLRDPGPGPDPHPGRPADPPGTAHGPARAGLTDRPRPAGRATVPAQRRSP